jgi:hypothetical protein
MLSVRLIHLIESHAEELTRGVIQELKTHSRTESYPRFSDLELHDRVYAVYKNLGAWTAGKAEDEVRRHYEELGRRRVEEGVPLPQVIFAQILTKNHLLKYIQTHGLGGTALEIYAEQELRNQVDAFFDRAIYYTSLGYYNAQQHAKPHTASRT